MSKKLSISRELTTAKLECKQTWKLLQREYDTWRKSFYSNLPRNHIENPMKILRINGFLLAWKSLKNPSILCWQKLQTWPRVKPIKFYVKMPRNHVENPMKILRIFHGKDLRSGREFTVKFSWIKSWSTEWFVGILIWQKFDNNLSILHG